MSGPLLTFFFPFLQFLVARRLMLAFFLTLRSCFCRTTIFVLRLRHLWRFNSGLRSGALLYLGHGPFDALGCDGLRCLSRRRLRRGDLARPRCCRRLRRWGDRLRSGVAIDLYRRRWRRIRAALEAWALSVLHRTIFALRCDHRRCRGGRLRSGLAVALYHRCWYWLGLASDVRALAVRQGTITALRRDDRS